MLPHFLSDGIPIGQDTTERRHHQDWVVEVQWEVPEQVMENRHKWGWQKKKQETEIKDKELCTDTHIYMF